MTPRLIRVTGQVTLAAGDVPGLCPVADVGGAVSPDPLWKLAGAMCAAIAGDDISGAAAFDAIRDGGDVDPFDIQLGERIAAVSLGNGRAANLDWDSVTTITPFRFGVAAAAGVAVPLSRLTELAAKTGGTSWGWVLRNPAETAEARAAALRPAAMLGIASAEDMVGAISCGERRPRPQRARRLTGGGAAQRLCRADDGRARRGDADDLVRHGRPTATPR